jgi:hypothetical protein
MIRQGSNAPFASASKAWERITVRSASTRISVAGAMLTAVTVVFDPGCSPPPPIRYAQLLERGASWASALVFADELADAGRVPPKYVRDVVRTAAREVPTLRNQTMKIDALPPSRRGEAAAALDELVAALDGAARSAIPPEREKLHAIEMRLRDLAHDARERQP